MKVFINPGHAPNGQPDQGAVNQKNGMREADQALELGLLVRGYLLKAGCDVMLLQSDNLCGEAAGPNVVRTANDSGADLFVSIHCNAFNGKARGIETLCYGQQPGRHLAACIQHQLMAALRKIDPDSPNRGVKKRPDLAVLHCTAMPAALVEAGFIDNTEDAWLLYQYKDDIARAIARGVTDWERDMGK